jgi:hypothetical protein
MRLRVRQPLRLAAALTAGGRRGHFTMRYLDIVLTIAPARMVDTQRHKQCVALVDARAAVERLRVPLRRPVHHLFHPLEQRRI